MTAVHIEGLSKLHREFKALDPALVKELKATSKEAAEIVADDARTKAPRLTGRLIAGIKAGALASGAYVKAGKVPYAKPIHFGWPRHNIEPQPFLYDALDDRRGEAIEKFEAGLAALLERSFSAGTGE